MAYPIRATIGNILFKLRNSPDAWMTIGWIPELTGILHFILSILIIAGKYANDVTCKRQLYHNCMQALFAQEIEWQKFGGMFSIPCSF